MDIKHLYYFIAVAEELHFSKAAKRLNIAQPPLSQQIRNLENELGVELFNRSKRHVELTVAGEILKKNTYNIIEEINKVQEEVKYVYDGKKGVLKVGFTGSVTFDLLPKLIKTYEVEYPNINIQLRQLTTSDQIAALKEGSIDLGILVTPINEDDLTSINLYQERFIAILPKDHPLVLKNHPLTAEELVQYPLIVPPRMAGAVYHDSILSFFRDYGLTPKIAHEVEELQTIVSLTSFDLGIALLPASMKSVPTTFVHYRDIKDTFKTTISIAYRTNSINNRIINFVNFIEGKFKND